MGVSGILICSNDNRRRNLISDSVSPIKNKKETKKMNDEKNQKIEEKIRDYLKCMLFKSQKGKNV